MGYLRKIASGIWRRIDLSDGGRVKRIMKNPPPIEEDHIVFTSSCDYSGNPKALFLYMIENGYNEKYRFTWLFERAENYIEFDIPNVSSEIIWNKRGIRRPAAQRAAMSARYIFYSHNVNWIRKFRDGQTFVDLWHGCGYKADMKSDKRKIYYDYLIVTGRKYIDIFKEVLKKPDGNVLDLGYPRNEFFMSNRSEAADVVEEIKARVDAEKAIIWLPTYRKSVFARLDSDTSLGSTGLPILYDNSYISEVDRWCQDNKVLLILKRHFLQQDYEVPKDKYKNILFIDDQFLKDRNADFYELMEKTDALLTDYSSVAIDYMLLDKPIGYTLDDYDAYEDARGWSFENVKDYMPGHHIYSLDDLKDYILDVSKGDDPYKEWRKKILPDVHTYTEGFSKRILDYFGI